MKQIILCSADSVYLKEYSFSLFKSAESAGFNVHLDLMVNDVPHGLYPELDFVNSYSSIPKNLTKDQLRIFYSCGRINALIKCMKIDVNQDRINAYMALDIDSIVNRSFRFPVNEKTGLSFYFRDPKEHGAASPWEYRGMKLLGTFFVTTKMLPYLKKVQRMIEDNNYSHWFIDQVALYESMSPQDLADAHDYSKDNIIGWDVDNLLATPIVTGKGQRKYHKNYIELQNAYKELMMKDLGEENVEDSNI